MRAFLSKTDNVVRPSQEERQLSSVTSETHKKLLIARNKNIDIAQWAEVPAIYGIKDFPVLSLLSGYDNDFGFTEERKLYGAIVRDDVICKNPNDVLIIGLNDDQGIKIIHFASKIIKDQNAFNVVGRFFVGKDELVRLYQQETKAAVSNSVENFQDIDKWIVGFRSKLFTAAVEKDATDIHLMLRNTLEIQFRVNKSLITYEQSLPYAKGERLLNALYGEFCKSDIDHSASVPGSKIIQISVFGKMENRFVRYQQMPTQVVADNQSSLDVVLRVLGSNKKASHKSLYNLGFDAEAQAVFDSVSRKSMGVVLMSGPTGSGKTTTLNCFYELVQGNSGNDKIIRTIENPPEGLIHGVSKSPLFPNGDDGKGEGGNNPIAIGAFNAMLRMDPDCIGVGEIRESVFGKMTFEAAMTGHLVCSTFHVSRWVDVYRRLIEVIGLQQAVVTGSGVIQLVVIQRLMSKVCSKCGLNYNEFNDTCNEYQRREVARFIKKHCDDLEVKKLRFIKSKIINDCSHCNGTGVKGMKMIYEMFVPSQNKDCMELINNGQYDQAMTAWSEKASNKSRLHGFSILDRAIEAAKSGELCTSDVIYFAEDF